MGMKTPISILGVILGGILVRERRLGYGEKLNSEGKEGFVKGTGFGGDEKLQLRAYFGPSR